MARTAGVARRYDRIARVYDLWEAPMDFFGGRRRRERVVGRASGRTLEVGIGTGRNLPVYRAGSEVTGVDISRGMLSIARKRLAVTPHIRASLAVADVEALPFPDATFDTSIATCVFCSVENPIVGLAEMARVTKSDGRILLVEHVRPRTRPVGWLFDRLSPIVQRVMGPAINRDTESNIRSAGLQITEIRRNGVWREMSVTAHPQN